jgi:glycosyltransferase involved in cell wall biosynthesis
MGTFGVRLLFLERSLNRGGAERQLVALCLGLKRRGHDVIVTLFYDEGVYIGDLRDAGIPVRIIGKSGRGDIIGFFRRLRHLIADEEPDLLCTFLPDPNIVAALCKLLQRRLLLVWGVRASKLDLRRYDWLIRFVSGVEPIFARVADLIIANSQVGRANAIARGFPGRRLVVVPNGIDTDRFRPDLDGRRRLREAWGYDDGTIVVGLIGRLDHMKGHSVFLRAAALLNQRRPHVAFVCVGDDGPVPRESLQQIAATLGVAERVRWIPGCDDMPAVFSACDLIASTSIFGEGFSNVLAEAMSCGRRCVATDVGDASLILGSTGIVVPPNDPASFARALDEACAEILRGDTFSPRARDRIIEHFSIERMVSNYEQLLARVVARRKSRFALTPIPPPG